MEIEIVMYLGWKGVKVMLKTLKETMILKDDAEKQIVLNRGLLIKTFSVSVYNKKTRKERVYRNKRIMYKLIKECI